MGYFINRTDGTVLATVPVGKIDNTSTSVTLVGKHATNFGEHLDENFVHLLENFASPQPPKSPMRGQLWYNTATGKITVYNGANFQQVSSSVTTSPAPPLRPAVGELWINSTTNQLHFHNGNTFILVGPQYTQSQELSGLKVVSLLDNLGITRTVTMLYISNVLQGIFSNVRFKPQNAIDGFSYEYVEKGFTEAFPMLFKTTAVRSQSTMLMAMSLDITGFTSNNQISDILDKIAPHVNSEYASGVGIQNGSEMRIHVIERTEEATYHQDKVFIMSGGVNPALGFWGFDRNLGFAYQIPEAEDGDDQDLPIDDTDYQGTLYEVDDGNFSGIHLIIDNGSGPLSLLEEKQQN